jgi:hypothetical protein
MITDAEAVLNHGANPRQCPALGLEAGAHRPPREDLEHLAPLGGCQPRRTTRLGVAPQSGEPLREIAESLRPLADGGGADVESPCNLGLGEMAGAEEAAGYEPTLFELFGSEFAWLPHAYQRNARASSR